jgi:amino acid permease
MTTPTPETTEPTAIEEAKQREAERQQRTIVISAVIFLVILVAGIVTALYFLLRPETPGENVERLRDVFIIFMALESLLIGVALIVLIVQFASLINLLQNEVRPILDATNETVSHLRGTAEFLGENVVEPVIKLNGYLAGMQRMLELLGVKKK